MEFLIPFSSKINIKDGKTENRSFYLILIAIIFCILFTTLFRILGFYNLASSSLIIAQWISNLLYLFGLLIRYWSLVLLGDYFTRNLKVEKGQKLVEKGLYRYIRHPSYLGLLLLTLGVVGFIGNILGFATIPLILFPALRSRIEIEEKMMLEVLGEDYAKWRENRYKLLPLIY
ncbi:MAG: Protein-S-isoprenylcysteine methyltransferase STE14 [Candidatus Methanohalarchaeum thermophilum]|uniref:Protein-S-isoprenylcysteine methyltransferase STE14 n=1 Tax=Methanohalarchaeum thermophilum TaxID=1903181 RepID=A0A1Q6DXG1_METT1|nr:MAG: Protein-S-isoprenylcysteine methyltransferase STE14 [Candidatus Methanohalarchaeum thermophilum]